MDDSQCNHRLEQIVNDMADVKTMLARIEAECVPCRRLVDSHQAVLHGNGQQGLVARMLASESGRVDTLSVKSVVLLLGALGTLCGAVGGAVGALVKVFVAT